ncbi:MAG: class I SAM-dependent methyltransferase [Deltaproteobacteria bacterium]|nr:class I SAM-dependent methyltransferase [Deltaproteobacteria bacterium]MDD9872977.1 class I SAM-dependent methyltransferase [Deltaproteobacteria bacterium]
MTHAAEASAMASPITWADGNSRHSFACRACGVNAGQSHVLDIPNPNEDLPKLQLYRCGRCDSLNYAPFHMPPEIPWEQRNDEQREHARACVKFYVEQAAGVDTLASMLFAIPQPLRDAETRFVEVGCGYGFSLDMARQMFGWEAIGVDPSTIAFLGGQQLGVNILNEYIAPGFQLPGGLGDVVLCAEVIEHIEEPRDFLACVSGLIADDGYLLLTTPDAAGCTPHRAESDLLPMLSPSCHTMLFSKQALKALLQHIGFTHIDLQSTGNTLRALASRSPKTLAKINARRDVSLYLHYLRERSQTLPEGTPVQHGLLYRWFKELVQFGLYEEALPVFEKLARSYQRRYRVNLMNPNSAARLLIRAPRANFMSFMNAVPINLCGILYYRGMIALNFENNKIRSHSYFHNAEAVGSSLMNFFQMHSMSDGEIANLTLLGRDHAHLSQKQLAAMRWLQITRQRVRNFLRKN